MRTSDVRVGQAKQFSHEYAFKYSKLKAGFPTPNLAVEATLNLHVAFQEHALRIETWADWTVPMPVHVDVPLVTDLMGGESVQFFEANQKDAISIVLSDHSHQCGDPEFTNSKRKVPECYLSSKAVGGGRELY